MRIHPHTIRESPRPCITFATGDKWDHLKSEQAQKDPIQEKNDKKSDSSNNWVASEYSGI